MSTYMSTFELCANSCHAEPCKCSLLILALAAAVDSVPDLESRHLAQSNNLLQREGPAMCLHDTLRMSCSVLPLTPRKKELQLETSVAASSFGMASKTKSPSYRKQLPQPQLWPRLSLLQAQRLMLTQTLTLTAPTLRTLSKHTNLVSPSSSLKFSKQVRPQNPRVKLKQHKQRSLPVPLSSSLAVL